MADKTKAAAKADVDTADEQAVKESVVNAPPSATKRAVEADRIKDAYFLGGRWFAGDGSPLTDAESQLAHRAADKAAMNAREKALLGGDK